MVDSDSNELETGLDINTVSHRTLGTSEGGMCPRRRFFPLNWDIRDISFSITVVFCVTFLVRLSLVGHNTGKTALEDDSSLSLAETMAVRRERVVTYCRLKQPPPGPVGGGTNIGYKQINMRSCQEFVSA